MRGRCAWPGTPSLSRCSSASWRTKRKAALSWLTGSSDIGKISAGSPGGTGMLPDVVEWESFYVIVGSSAGALIGLQFVVLTLIAEKPQLATAEGGAAYLTPTIVHFGAVLLLSAVLRVPWHTIGAFATAWGLVGLAGIAYVAIVNLRMRRQEGYRAQLEDWLFHTLLPFA